jgi:transcriptional regulator of NAD metabolism
MVLPFIHFHLFTGVADQAGQTICNKKERKKEKETKRQLGRGYALQHRPVSHAARGMITALEPTLEPN